MTLQEVLMEADRLRPNPLDDGQKAGWVAAMEVRVAEETGRQAPLLRWPEDGQCALTLPPEYASLYVLYLCARIDFALGEYEGYNGAITLYNATLGDYKKSHLRRNLPEKRTYVHVWRVGV